VNGLSNKKKQRKRQTTKTAIDQSQTLPPPKKQGPIKRAFSWLMRSIGAAMALGLVALIYNITIDNVEGKWGGPANLYLHSEPLDQNSPTYLFYAVPKGSRNARFLVPIQLSVLNDSRRPAQNATLSIRYDKRSDRSVISSEFIRSMGGRKSSDISHEFNAAGRYDHSIFRAAFLPPGEKASFVDGAFTSPIDFGDKFPILFSTGTGLDLRASIYSENNKTRDWDIRYRGIEVDNGNGIEWWVKNWYGKHVAIETRRTVGFWQYLYGLLVSKKITVYGFAPDFRSLNGGSIYLPGKSPDSYTGFKFSPYVWSLLWDFS
jgi:hypothetical protein